ncbi:MAG: MucB/RseB C-terminal domain-containing protein [Neisseriaceae bacterium]|nr:MucB/RseB C-terminal domain-containing protein [Neisseriaceae bacterium]
MPRYSYILCLSTLCFCTIVNAADDTQEWEELRIASWSERNLSLQGQYIRQVQHGFSSYNIYRLYDKKIMIDRRVALNGIPREIIKTPERISFYSINSKGVTQAHMDSVFRFLDMLPADINVLQNSYTVSRKSDDWIAGKECHWILLSPKDNNRYTQGFCLSPESGYLPLAQIYKKGQNTVELNLFTTLKFAEPEDKLIKPSNSLTIHDSLNLPPEPTMNHIVNKKINDNYIKSLPESFFILSSKDIVLQSDNANTRHYVISDGLVHISLFVENNSQNKELLLQGGTINGALSIASISKENGIKLTAVGDLPPNGLRNLINHVKIKENIN